MIHRDSNCLFVLFIFLFSVDSYSTNNTKGRALNLRTRIVKTIEKIDEKQFKKQTVVDKNPIEKPKKEPYRSCCSYNFRDRRDFLRHQKTTVHRRNQKNFAKIISNAQKIISTIPYIFPGENITNKFLTEIILDPIKRSQLQNYVKENNILTN